MAYRLFGCAVALALAAQSGFATAAELKVYSTIGMRSVLEELKPKFEQASGHKLDITWGLAAGLTKRDAGTAAGAGEPQAKCGVGQRPQAGHHLGSRRGPAQARRGWGEPRRSRRN